MADGDNHQDEAENPVLVRGRKGRTHITGCGTGYLSASWYYREVHHILCISCVTDAEISEQFEGDEVRIKRIKDCLDLTNWNINDSHNTVGLPKKRAYYKMLDGAWDGWPCHQVDHNVTDGYTDSVATDLKTKVWEPAIEVAEDCEFEASALQEALKIRSKAWLNFLETRGGKNEGTKYCWDNRFAIEDGSISLPEPWYFPFSMHPSTPTKRKPPPDESTFSGIFKDILSATFGR